MAGAGQAGAASANELLLLRRCTQEMPGSKHMFLGATMSRPLLETGRPPHRSQCSAEDSDLGRCAFQCVSGAPAAASCNGSASCALQSAQDREVQQVCLPCLLLSGCNTPSRVSCTGLSRAFDARGCKNARPILVRNTPPEDSLCLSGVSCCCLCCDLGHAVGDVCCTFWEDCAPLPCSSASDRN